MIPANTPMMSTMVDLHKDIVKPLPDPPAARDSIVRKTSFGSNKIAAKL
jgi:hypothetical protein